MILFRDKTLNLAIILSTIWHFFWIASVAPFFEPSSVRTYGQTIISFIGAVLNEVAPKNHGRDFEKTDLETKPTRPLEIPLERPQGDSKPVVFEKEEGIIYEKKIIEFKRLPSRKQTQVEEIVKIPEVEIFGEAKQREFLYRPKFPIFPKWQFYEDLPYEIRFRFFISPGGKVLAVDKLTSSGSAIIDEMAYRYVRDLKFLPLKREDSDNPDEGIIALRFQ